MDLMDMVNIAKQNADYKCLLVAIDIFPALPIVNLSKAKQGPYNLYDLELENLKWWELIVAWSSVAKMWINIYKVKIFINFTPCIQRPKPITVNV